MARQARVQASKERDERVCRDWRREHAGSGLTSRLILTYVEREAGGQAVREVLQSANLSEAEAQLRDENHWFSYETKLGLWSAAEEVLGDPQVAEHVGAAVLELSVAMGLKRTLRALGTPAFVYANVARANAKFNWAHQLEVVSKDATSVRMRYVDLADVGYHRYAGLSNQRAFFRQCAVEFGRGERSGASVSIVMLDLDFFKKINDDHGHPYGDQVLLGVADALRDSVRKQDTVARMGGEEFAMLLPETDAATAYELAERARAAIAGVPVNGNPLSCSAGVAAMSSGDTTAPLDLLELADKALYQAKHLGRDRTVEAGSELCPVPVSGRRRTVQARSSPFGV